MNLSPPDTAKRREISSCSSERMFTTNTFEVKKCAWLSALRSTHTRRSGGTSDTEVTALAVSPKGRPASSRVVMTVTPVQK